MRLIKVVDATKVYNGIALYMAENAYLNDTALDVLKMVANWLNEAPTVDAVEVVHGRWINIVDYGGGKCFGFCSNCAAEQEAQNATALKAFHKYCRWCGASMMAGERRDGE